MELLKKTIANEKEKKMDNCDKKELLEKGRHPQSAGHYKDEWSFIDYLPARENIAYQLQYLEYMTNLYNDYQMYLTIESLHCKNMMVTIASVMESALYDLLYQLAKKRSDIGFDEKEDFWKLIDSGHRGGLIDGRMKYQLHELRKVRNFVHITSLEHQEYSAYDTNQVNCYITLLNDFKKRIDEKYEKMIKF